MDLKIKLLIVNTKIYQLIYKLWLKSDLYIHFLIKIYKNFSEKKHVFFKFFSKNWCNFNIFIKKTF